MPWEDIERARLQSLDRSPLLKTVKSQMLESALTMLPVYYELGHSHFYFEWKTISDVEDSVIRGVALDVAQTVCKKFGFRPPMSIKICDKSNLKFSYISFSDYSVAKADIETTSLLELAERWDDDVFLSSLNKLELRRVERAKKYLPPLLKKISKIMSSDVMDSYSKGEEYFMTSIRTYMSRIPKTHGQIPSGYIDPPSFNLMKPWSKFGDLSYDFTLSDSDLTNFGQVILDKHLRSLGSNKAFRVELIGKSKYGGGSVSYYIHFAVYFS